jgi:hypothetical protein
LVSGALREVANLGPNSRLVNLQGLPIWLAQKMIGGEPSFIKNGPLQQVATPDTGLLILMNAILIVVCVGILALRYRRSDA